MGIGAKLRAELDSRGMSVAELARLASVSPTTIYSVLRRDSDKANRDFIVKICAALQIPYESLLGRPLYDIVFVDTPSKKHEHWATPIVTAYEAAEVPTRRAACNVLEIPYVDPDKPVQPETTKLPNVISMQEYKVRTIQKLVYKDPAAAGVPLSAESDYEHIEFPEDDVPYNADFGIRISGRSMEPDIKDGDIVWVHKQSSVHDGEVGVFMIDGDAVCKRACVDRYFGLVELKSDNEECEDIICADLPDDVLVRTVGRVVGTCRLEE